MFMKCQWYLSNCIVYIMLYVYFFFFNNNVIENEIDCQSKYKTIKTVLPVKLDHINIV